MSAPQPDPPASSPTPAAIVPALAGTMNPCVRIAQLIRDHATDEERDELLAYHGFNEEMTGAALTFICSDSGEDADGDGIDELRRLAMANGGDVGEQHCTLTSDTCDHHDHQDAE